MPQKSLTRYLTTKQAADILELSEDYLYRLRCTPGCGPRYRRHGSKVRYAREDLEAWDVKNTHG